MLGQAELCPSVWNSVEAQAQPRLVAVVDAVEEQKGVVRRSSAQLAADEELGQDHNVFFELEWRQNRILWPKIVREIDG
eukprot:115408-Pleurochrysis_carterae.AAC.1